MSEYQELVDRFLEVVDVLIELERQLNKIDEKIARLEQWGMTDATIHWRRKDDPEGKPDMLELVHRSNSDYERSTGRRREYIGTNPVAIKEAIEKRRRFGQVRELEGQRASTRKQADNIRWAITNVFKIAKRQQGLWGQNSARRTDQVSPNPVQNNGDNGEWGHQAVAGLDELSPQASVSVSPKSMSPQNMAEVKAYFEQSPELASIAKDLPE